MTIYNTLIDHRFFIYCGLAALPILLGVFKDRTNLRILGLIYLYFLFHYLWGYPWHDGGWIGLALFALFTGYVAKSFWDQHQQALSGLGQRSFWYVVQIALLVIFALRAFRAGNNLLLGKSYISSKHRLHISSPLDPSQSYAVINGGYRAANNSEFDVPAKKFALHFRGEAAQLKVQAPCDAEVKKIVTADAKAQDGKALLTMPEAQRYGSSIVIKCFGTTEMLALSNLDPATITVKAGDTVERGQAMALTGQTEYRHRTGLIIHGIYTNSLDAKVLFETGEGVPLKIDGQYYVKNESTTVGGPAH